MAPFSTPDHHELTRCHVRSFRVVESEHVILITDALTPEQRHGDHAAGAGGRGFDRSSSHDSLLVNVQPVLGGFRKRTSQNERIFTGVLIIAVANIVLHEAEACVQHPGRVVRAPDLQ